MQHLWFAWIFLGLLACHGASSNPQAHAAASASSLTAPVVDLASLRKAELRRDSAGIGDSALSSRDLQVRRSAARALARIADARAVELLSLALSDEDGEVVTWAAYGLGYACKGHEAKTVRALVARAASLDERAVARAPLANPSEAIADALGRCGGSEAESTLRAWLVGPKTRAEAAALALGRIATQSGKLADATLVALLESADRTENPLNDALYPCTRLSSFNDSTEERLRALASKIIATQGAGLEFAVRALGRTGDEGIAALGTLLADPKQEPNLRAEAVRELATLGAPGQRALWAAFDATTTTMPSDSELSSASYGALSALLDALTPPIPSSGKKLQAFSELPLVAADSATSKRRKVHLRCQAAALLAGSNYQSTRLLGCDANGDAAVRELGMLRAMGREKLRGSRKQAYLKLTQSKDPLIREAAIGLLAEHNELAESYRVLADALGEKSLGVVASAARVLARYPERAASSAEGAEAHSAPKPDSSIVHALGTAYAAARDQHSVEVQSLLLDAIGALEILSLKSEVALACIGDNPTLREHAEKSLRLLGEESRHCDKFEPNKDASVVDPPWPRSVVTLETDAGTLTLELDASFAPSAVARIVALVQAGFYDGVAVHRVVPGFVAQFGDPSGDGYGGDAEPPLRCETSPIAFGLGSVGVALAGRDTGSSQLFVTLGRYPHLDGDYAWIGQAGPGWDQLAAGDRIVHARVGPAP
ncbi:MAG TPA: peptidylprolyl isomerase [Polyangiaceae bacterium]|jgi:cyclophilin family peptidyl-prolyl cis-trans isomerase